MKTLIFSLGTRGDFEVFALLARALAERGHRVTLAGSPFYEPLVPQGAAWLPIGSGTQAELVSVIRSLADIDDKRERVRAYAERWVRPQLAASSAALKQAALETDYFINNLRSVWQRGGQTIPGAEVTYDPPADPERLGRYASQQPAHAHRILQLVAMNRALVDPDDRWGAQYRFTGFWRPPARPWEPSPGLAQFLAEGTPPVVLTMGSMVMFDPDRLTATFAEALTESGQRGIVITSWAGRGRGALSSDRMFLADEIPYGWLFPRASCVVHHGGCGTVAAVLAAGKPSILLPQISSQEHFGRLLARQNLVAAVCEVGQLTSATLAGAIRVAVEQPELRGAAGRWSALVCDEPGVGEAAQAIQAHAAQLGLT